MIHFPWQANAQQPSRVVIFRLDPLLDSGATLSPQETGKGRTGGSLYLYSPQIMASLSPQQTGKGRTGGPLYQSTPATTAVFSGPTSGTVGVPSTNFTVTINGTYAGTITPSDSGASGTFTPVTISGDGTFTYTAFAAGTKSISISASPSLTISGSPISYLATVGAAGGGGSSLSAEQMYYLALRRQRKIKDGPTVPGFRARQR